MPEEVLAAAAARVDALLNVYSGGLTIPGMKQLVKEVRGWAHHCGGCGEGRAGATSWEGMRVGQVPW